MAAFVGFDPVKSHRAQIVRLVSLCVVVVAAALIAYTHFSV
ncbi:MAG: hypothetical protein ACLPN5_16320 [Roseiarcus sp.]